MSSAVKGRGGDQDRPPPDQPAPAAAGRGGFREGQEAVEIAEDQRRQVEGGDAGGKRRHRRAQGRAGGGQPEGGLQRGVQAEQPGLARDLGQIHARHRGLRQRRAVSASRPSQREPAACSGSLVSGAQRRSGSDVAAVAVGLGGATAAGTRASPRRRSARGEGSGREKLAAAAAHRQDPSARVRRLRARCWGGRASRLQHLRRRQLSQAAVPGGTWSPAPRGTTGREGGPEGAPRVGLRHGPARRLRSGQPSRIGQGWNGPLTMAVAVGQQGASSLTAVANGSAAPAGAGGTAVVRKPPGWLLELDSNQRTQRLTVACSTN